MRYVIEGSASHAAFAECKLGKVRVRRHAEQPKIVLTLQEDRLSDDGSPGQLHKVKLINFMCHEHFEMDFW